MKYSFSSLVMVFVSSNVLLIIISICLHFRKIMINMGYKLIAFFLGFVLLRFLFPFALPFAVNLHLPTSLSSAFWALQHPFYSIYHFAISCWTIFELIWIIGILVNLMRDYRLRLRTKILVSFGKDITNFEPFASLLSRACQEKGKHNCFRIIQMSGIPVPMLYGVFSPCILLPARLPLSDEELYFAISHEIAHHHYRDLLLKSVVNCLLAVYWWNPASYALREKIDLIIEMRVDDQLTKGGHDATSAYLRCLLHIKEYITEHSAISTKVSLSLLRGMHSDLDRRFHMLCAKNKQRKKGLNMMMTALILSVYILSYLLTF